MSPVVVHDLVVQVLLVGQVPVGRQVLLVRLLVEVAQLGCGGTGGEGGLCCERGWARQGGSPRLHSQGKVVPHPWGRDTVPAGARLPLHCSRWETSSAALLSLQGSRPRARSFLIWRVKRYLWRGHECALRGGGGRLSQAPG